MARTTTPKRGFGNVRQAASGRWQVVYLHNGKRHYCPTGTFATKGEAEGWAANERRMIDLGIWTPPAERAAAAEAQAQAAAVKPITFGEYAERTIDNLVLRPRGREGYHTDRRLHLEPTFGEMALRDITPALVREWYIRFKSVKTGKDAPTARARAYETLRRILNVAIEDELITANPCRIKAAAKVQPAHVAQVLSPAELERLAAAMPSQWRMSVSIAGWCGLRKGETWELRRGDVSADHSTITVARSMSDRGGKVTVKDTKTGEARTVVVPPHLREPLADHLREHVGPSSGALLFSKNGSHLRDWTYRTAWNAACASIGRPKFRIQELRHTGATTAALAGGTVKEVQDRLGHKTVNAAMRYQALANGRREELAQAMSELAKK